MGRDVASPQASMYGMPWCAVVCRGVSCHDKIGAAVRMWGRGSRDRDKGPGHVGPLKLCADVASLPLSPSCPLSCEHNLLDYDDGE